MATAYYFDHGPEIKISHKKDSSIDLDSITFLFKVAGKDVTENNIREQYQELFTQLQKSKAFRGLVNSNNMEIGVVQMDGANQFLVQLKLQNGAVFSYNHVANPRQTALDTIEKVFAKRFNPMPNP